MAGIRGRQGGAGKSPDQRQDWWGPVLDTPDPPALARFYSAVLGWKIGGDDDGGWCTVHPGEGVAYIGFHRNPDYVRPVWPPADGQQQMMMHLDLEVSDLAEAVASALELGAAQAEFQPQHDVRVMLDPDGHPFCLYAHGD